MATDPTRSAAIKAMWERRRAQPEVMAAHCAKLSASRLKKIDEDPEFAAALSVRSGAILRKLHQEPDFRKRANQRRSDNLNTLWADPVFREQATARNISRYLAGTGIASPESEARKREAARWIMKKCSEELLADTEYVALYTETQARLRRERPYEGPTDNAYYMEYLAKLGRAVLGDPVLSKLRSDFMRTAVPRWSAAWHEHVAHRPK